MKKNIIFINLLILFWNMLYSQESDFYYSLNKKNYLNNVKNKFTICNNGSDLDSKLLKHVVTLSPLSSVVSFKDTNVSLQEAKKHFKNIIPVKKLGTTELIFTGEILLKPFENVNIQKIINLTNGGIEIKYYTKYNTYVMDVLTWDSIFIYANRIYESGLVKYCHPNFIAPVEPHSDPMYSQQYYLNNQNNIDINAPEAWAIINNQQTIRIAIIDEGVEDHEDLNNKVLQGMTVSYSNSRPNTYGRPCSISQPTDALNRSTFAHGQSCAGIVTADHNNIGIKGVINNAEIVPINIFNNWYDTTINYYGFPIKMIFYRETANDYATAINEAWDTYACDVINNSWGYKYVEDTSKNR